MSHAPSLETEIAHPVAVVLSPQGASLVLLCRRPELPTPGGPPAPRRAVLVSPVAATTEQEDAPARACDDAQAWHGLLGPAKNWTAQTIRATEYPSSTGFVSTTRGLGAGTPGPRFISGPPTLLRHPASGRDFSEAPPSRSGGPGWIPVTPVEVDPIWGGGDTRIQYIPGGQRCRSKPRDCRSRQDRCCHRRRWLALGSRQGRRWRRQRRRSLGCHCRHTAVPNRRAGNHSLVIGRD